MVCPHPGAAGRPRHLCGASPRARLLPTVPGMRPLLAGGRGAAGQREPGRRGVQSQEGPPGRSAAGWRLETSLGAAHTGDG